MTLNSLKYFSSDLMFSKFPFVTINKIFYSKFFLRDTKVPFQQVFVLSSDNEMLSLFFSHIQCKQINYILCKQNLVKTLQQFSLNTNSKLSKSWNISSNIEFIKKKTLYKKKNYVIDSECFEQHKINSHKTLTNTTSYRKFKLILCDRHRVKFILINPNNNLTSIRVQPQSNMNLCVHKNILTPNIPTYFNNSVISPNSPLKKQLLLQLMQTTAYRDSWLWTNLTSYKLPLNLGSLRNLVPINSTIEKAIDITSGLYSIETIFEAFSTKSKYLIATDLSIITKTLFQYYTDTQEIFITKGLLKIPELNEPLWVTSMTHTPIQSIEQQTSIVAGGSILTAGGYAPSAILENFFASMYQNKTQFEATKNTLNFAFTLIVESLTKQYLLNGIFLPSIHFELMAKKMVSCVKIEASGDTSLGVGDVVPFTIIASLNYTFVMYGYITCMYKPIILGLTKSTLACSGLLAAVSFQETTKKLSKAALQSTTDWLTDLKSKIIATDLLPTGTGWYRYFQK